ncbi:MAG: thioesterase family protein [Pseudomonadota bacterium]|nr:thioesterase family protein [Pseudomonadota bacterium]
MKIIHQEIFTIYYENTDSSGFTYHTSYLSFAERARSNMLKQFFPDVMNMLIENKFFFVVRKLNVSFLRPSHLFDNLEITTYFNSNTYTSVDLVQKIKKEDLFICDILVTLVWINGKTLRPSRVPYNIISRFKSLKVV